MRHALEPDHLTAVSTLISRERNGYKAALLGAWWGSATPRRSLLVGAVLVLLRAEMPTARRRPVRTRRRGDAGRARPANDCAGCSPRGRRAPRASTRRTASSISIRRAGARAHRKRGRSRSGRSSSAPYMGLAGSGALTALVLTTLPSTHGADCGTWRSSGWVRPSGWPPCRACSGGRSRGDRFARRRRQGYRACRGVPLDDARNGVRGYPLVVRLF